MHLLGVVILTGLCTAEDLGKGYSRKGEFIFFKGKRIDQEGAHDIDKFSRAARQKLTLCSNVEAVSFKVLSEQLHDTYFDVVTLYHVIEHLPSPKTVLKEIARIIKNTLNNWGTYYSLRKINQYPRSNC